MALPILQDLEQEQIPITQEPVNPTTDQLIQKFYNTREKAPVLDQAKVERLQRMGRINEAGQGVKVLADIAGSIMGANTRKRQPDVTAPALYQSYQNTLDKFEAQKDAFDYRDFQTSRQNVQFGIGRADRKDDIAYRNARQALVDKIAAAKNETERLKYEAELKRKDREAAERERHNKAMENKKTGKETVVKPYMVAGINGKDVPLTQGEFRQTLNEAISTEAFYTEDLKTAMSQFVNYPDQQEKQIVQRFKEWKAAKDTAKEMNDPKYKAAEDKLRKEKGISTTVAGDLQTTPKANTATKKDWSVYKEKTAK